MAHLSRLALLLFCALCCLIIPFAPVARAQDTSREPPSSTRRSEQSPTSSTSATPARTHRVDVGFADHRFKPDIIVASAGDIVSFHFGPKNHSVTRAAYLLPCIPYEMTGRGRVGFWSGMVEVDVILEDPPKWNLLINDTDPVFFYCSAPGSCNDWGMVGVINPNASTSLERHRQEAKAASYVLNPGEPFPAEASSTMASLTAVPSAGSDDEDSEGSGKGGLSTGAIVGIAIGGVALLLLAAALFFFVGRNKTLREDLKNRQSLHNPLSPTGPVEMYQNQGGGIFLPVKPTPDLRASVGAPYDVPPYQQSPEMGSVDGTSMRAASPGLYEYGTIHGQDNISSRMHEAGSSPPRSQASPGPHEMYVPETTVSP